MRMMKNLFKTMLSAALFTCAAMSVQAQNWQWTGETYTNDTPFYLVNAKRVDASGKNFVGLKGNDDVMVTRAEAQTIKVYVEGGDNKILFINKPSCGLNNKKPKRWDINPFTDDFRGTAYTISDGSYYLYISSGDVKTKLGKDDATNYWYFISPSQMAQYDLYDSYLAAYAKTKAYSLFGCCQSIVGSALTDYATVNRDNVSATISALEAINADCEAAISTAKAALLAPVSGNPIDATFLIANPSFETSDMAGWTVSDNLKGDDTNILNNTKNSTTGIDGEYMFNTWKDQIYAVTKHAYLGESLSQTITNVPNGKYILRAKACSQSGNNIILTANGVHTSIVGVSTDKTQSFVEGCVEFYVTNNQIDINMVGEEFSYNNTTGTHWFRADDFRLQYVPASVALSVKANKFGTFASPFAVTLPKNVDAYTAEVEGNIVHLTKKGDNLPANTPVIVSNLTDANISKNFYGIATPETSCTNDVLTGVFTATQVPVGAYVLQTQNDVQKFYIVENGKQPTLSPNKCYLNAHAGVKAIGFEGDATAVETIEALTSGSAKIYDLNGRQLHKLQKGINIINGKKVLVK